MLSAKDIFPRVILGTRQPCLKVSCVRLKDLTHMARAMYFFYPTHFINVINLVNLFRKKQLTWENSRRGDEEKRRNGEKEKKEIK